MPKLPLHLQAKPAADPRKHPIVGLTYRVRDKDWAEVWGVTLSWTDAQALTTKVISELKSKTARVEAEDLAVPEALWKVAKKATERAIASGRVPAGYVAVGTSAVEPNRFPDHPSHCDFRVIWSPEDQQYVGLVCQFPVLAALAADPEVAFSAILHEVSQRYEEFKQLPPYEAPDEVHLMNDGISGVIAYYPAATGNPQDPEAFAKAQLAQIQGGVLVAAGGEAAAAQKRADLAHAAEKRREEYKRQRVAAEAETKRLAAEADRVNAMLGEDAADVPEGDIDDLVGGAGAMPTDAEIRETKKKLAEEEAKRKQLGR